MMGSVVGYETLRLGPRRGVSSAASLTFRSKRELWEFCTIAKIARCDAGGRGMIGALHFLHSRVEEMHFGGIWLPDDTNGEKAFESPCYYC
jgi:hypothetical protein